jgi:23S rRNA (cytidine1920-2'-O)/16S rRNA (cytidine1409-2'-O)-methyltransferase
VTDFVSRGGLKLDHALRILAVEANGLVCADLGCSTGGFTDCWLRHNAARVYAVDTGYGVLDWKLRNDTRVVVVERTNAMHVTLPEAVDRISIDVAWTKQEKILPSARRLLKPDGRIVTLIKPHYEADPKQLRKGVLPEEAVASVVEETLARVTACGFRVLGTVGSPIKGSKGNSEVLALLAVETAGESDRRTV